MLPVVGHEVGAPDHDALLGHVVFHHIGADQAGDAEERRELGRVAERRGDRRDAIVQLGVRLPGLLSGPLNRKSKAQTVV